MNIKQYNLRCLSRASYMITDERTKTAVVAVDHHPDQHDRRGNAAGEWRERSLAHHDPLLVGQRGRIVAGTSLARRQAGAHLQKAFAAALVAVGIFVIVRNVWSY